MMNKKAIVRMVKMNMLMREIADYLGVSQDSLSKFMSRNGIYIRDLRPLFMKKRKPRTIEKLFDGFEPWRQFGRERTRHLVRVRDQFRCQHPGCSYVWKKGDRMPDVHHVSACGKKSRRYDSTKDLSGLVTLCHLHHMKFHQSGSTNTKGHLKNVSFSTLDDLRWQGFSYDAIAKKFGVSFNAIYRKLHNK